MHLQVSTFDKWRKEARQLLGAGVPPSAVHFDGSGQRGLFPPTSLPKRDRSAAPADRRRSPARVPPTFLHAARVAACHRAADRFELLYRVLWRLQHGEPRLMEIATDDDVHRLHRLAQAVRRDSHKMKAFVRFARVVDDEGKERFVAWHRPDHRVLRLTAPFFARRFPAMQWAILTPDESVTWDLEQLHYGPGVPASSAPAHDDLVDLWKTYYGSTFNPARIKLQTMKREMPVRHWRTLPETAAIPGLLDDAPRRVSEMVARTEGSARSAADCLPAERDWLSLRTAADRCEGCQLHGPATQTVFGEGPPDARIMLVGEQPGDSEDLAGRPFVGPAGEVLDDALRAAGLERSELYVTNAVKHFKYEPRGKRRLHQKPDAREMSACQPWLIAEIELVQPDVLVCLGATAAQSLIGRDFRITRQRGTFLQTRWCPLTIATYHPSAVLRAPVENRRHEVLSALISDLRLVNERVRG